MIVTLNGFFSIVSVGFDFCWVWEIFRNFFYVKFFKNLYRILDEQADKLRILSRKAEEVALFQVPLHQGVADILSFFQKFLIYFCPDFDIGCFKAVGSDKALSSMRWLLFDFSIRCGFRKQLVA